MRSGCGWRASPADVLLMVLRESLWLVFMGIAIGLPAAPGAARLISRLLYGLTPNDPPTIVIAALLLLVMALLACYLPARRATRVDAMIALR